MTTLPQTLPVTIMTARSDAELRQAGVYADVVTSQLSQPEAMRAHVEAVRAAASAAGRDPAAVKILFGIRPIMGASRAIAQEKRALSKASADTESGLAFLSATLGYDMALLDIDKPVPNDLPIRGSMGKYEQVKSSPQLTLREIADRESLRETLEMCGTYDDIADELAALQDTTGADGFFFRASLHNYDYLVEVATHLVPALQDKRLFRRQYDGTTLRDILRQD